MIKKVIVTSIALFIGNLVGSNAQEDFKQSLSGIKKIQLETNTAVHVKAGTTNEIMFSNGANMNCDDGEDHDHNHENHGHGHDDHKDKQDSKAKGLKAIYPGGVDNTGFGMVLEKEGDLLRIRDLKPFTQRHGFTVTLPKSIELNLDCGNLGSVYLEGLSSEIEINTNVGHIHLVNVTGPVTAHSSTGGINLEFVSVNQNAPISVSTATGDIDVSLPSSTKADVELKTTMGTVYTNFELEVPREDGMKVVGANRKIQGKLNNGGVKLNLTSSTGNIYFRKQ